jgi:hypothetical protein
MLILNTCKDNGIDSTIEPLSYMGFEDKVVSRLLFVDPYLYVCAGRDGLWRINIVSMSNEWEFLGLEDTSLSSELPRGVLDVVVLDKDILVAYNEAGAHKEPQSTVGIWRSNNDGTSWFRSDSGVPESITSEYEFNSFTAIKRSPHVENILFSMIAPTVYKSIDNGHSWEIVKERRGYIHNYGSIKFNPNSYGEAWFFGETSVSSSFLFCTKDFGDSFQNEVDFSSLFGSSNLHFIQDVCFDATNPDMIYVSLTNGLIKSNDGGYNWNLIKPDTPNESRMFLLAEDFRQNNSIFCAGFNEVFHSNDGLMTVNLIATITDNLILSIVFDEKSERLFISTTNGIYSLKIN